jgi:hypothetical protein
MPPTPTTTKSTPAAPSAASARVKPLTGSDTPRPVNLYLEFPLRRHRVENPGLVGPGSVPGPILDPLRDFTQRPAHAELLVASGSHSIPRRHPNRRRRMEWWRRRESNPAPRSLSTRKARSLPTEDLSRDCPTKPVAGPLRPIPSNLRVGGSNPSWRASPDFCARMRWSHLGSRAESIAGRWVRSFTEGRSAEVRRSQW